MATTENQAKRRALLWVADTKRVSDESRVEFESAVRDAQESGCSIRDIRDAAGLKSTSTIAAILSKK